MAEGKLKANKRPRWPYTLVQLEQGPTVAAYQALAALMQMAARAGTPNRDEIIMLAVRSAAAKYSTRAEGLVHDRLLRAHFHGKHGLWRIAADVLGDGLRRGGLE